MDKSATLSSPLFPQKKAFAELSIPWAKVRKQYREDLGIEIPELHEAEELRVYRCEQSNYRFYHPVIEGDEQFYVQLATKSSYYPVWKWEYSFAMKHIDPKSKVLEIGCGAGDFLQALKKEKDAEVIGLELGESQSAAVRELGIPCFSESIDQHAQKHENQYDVICFFQVLEHIAQPLTFLRSVLKALKPGGQVIFAVPNNTPYLYGCDIYHTLNLPPHHQGLWNVQAATAFEEALPEMKLKEVKTEPLSIDEIKAYLSAYRRYGRTAPFGWLFFNVLPKRFWILWADWTGMQGRNLAATFSKKG